MAGELPIYPDFTLRTRAQFRALDALKNADFGSSWEKADRFIADLEGALDVRSARLHPGLPSKAALLEMHGRLFEGRAGAGALRTTPVQPRYRGQDCVPPEFIERSIDNLMSWIAADSFSEIHAIEQAALAMTRLLDVWPFEFGNLTAAVVFSNVFLARSGFAPFYVRVPHMREFETIVAQAIAIETQPLINAIFTTVKQEMEALA